MRTKNRQQRFEQVAVVDAGAKGKAIAKAPDGRVIFLSNAVPGDVVDVLTTKKRKAYFEGTATHFHQLSARRTTPQCQHFGVCGGCKWQHMGYEHQLHYKQQEVEQNLRRIGHLQLPPISPIIGAAQPYFYRNKLEFSFSDSRWLTQEEVAAQTPIADWRALGFHIPGRWDKVLDIKKCHLQQQPSNAIRLAVKRFATEHHLSFFSPRKQTGLLRTLMIRTSTTGEVMVLLQFFEDAVAPRERLLRYLQQQFPEITALLYVVNTKPNDTLYDQEVVCFAGRDHIMEEMEGLRFKITAKSFYQTNSAQAYALYKIIRNFAGLTGEEVVYDLYTGTGTIAQFVAKGAKKVIGIEAVPEAIADAQWNAQHNGIHNTEFVVGAMKAVFTPAFMAQHGPAEVIITDPPRSGMHPAVVAQLLQAAPQRIVYVSCNSATQARDLALLHERYQLTHVQPIDMFPQTHHVENVVLLKLRG